MNDEHICIECNEKFFHDHDTMDMIYHKSDPIKYPLTLYCGWCDWWLDFPLIEGLPPHRFIPFTENNWVKEEEEEAADF